MLKILFLYTLAILLSLSILGPSYIALTEDNSEIEMVQDHEEDSQQENKKEIEEGEKFFKELFSSLESGFFIKKSSNFFYVYNMHEYILDVHSPPPRHFI